MKHMVKILRRVTVAAVLLPVMAWGQSPDPIVGTWNVSASLNGTPLYIGVMTFHSGGTLTEFDTAGTNSAASPGESIDSGVWTQKANGSYSFRAENYVYDSSGNLSELATVGCNLTLGSNQNSFKGNCTVSFFSCSLSQCPGPLQENFSYQVTAKRF